MALIDLSNYDTTLHQSDTNRAGTPTGNVFFDAIGGTQEFIDATELANYTPSYASASVSLTQTSPDQLVRDTGNFLTDGFRAGMNIGVTGTTANAGPWGIENISVDGLTITTVETSVTTEAGSGDEVVSGASTPNLLIDADGLKFEANYAFENQERASDEELRKFDRWTSGSFKFAGAYSYVKGRKPSTDADRKKLRGSGWQELNVTGVPLQKWFGMKGLSNIEATSQPYYQQAVQDTAVDFNEVGQIDEAILVYHDSNGDGTPDTVDKITYAAASVRTYGQTHDRKETTTDLGISELGGYSTGIALNEGPHLTTDPITNHPYVSVYGTPAGVWLNMELNHIPSPTAKSGEFEDETGTRLFSWELINGDSADLDDCVAWLDAFAASVDEADGLAVNTGHLGKDVETWYYYNAAGQVVTKSGVVPASEGLYIQNVPVADQQRIIMTDDSGALKNYEFEVSVEAEIGATAKSDTNAWYHAFEAALYNTSGAVTLTDSTPADVKGLASTADGSNKIIFARAYTADLNCVFLCEGDGGATQAKTLFTIIEQTTVAFACIPAVENNV